VDDGSTDDTWSHILEACRTDSRVRGLQHARSRGQSAALWTGFKASRGVIIATLDGDLQNDPADLPAMLAALSACDMVCGVRAKRQDTAIRRISSAVARLARRAALGVDFRDTGCNLRVFKRAVLETIPPFDGLHRFMPVLAHGAGAAVKEMPVAHHPRTAGRTKYGVWNRLGRGVYDLAMVRWYLKRQIKTLTAPDNCAEAEPASAGGQARVGSNN
jgi:dolichol-phosphate mannosyltransferase